MKTRNLVLYALCLAVALALSYIESLWPFSTGIPGAKLGLPNMVTVFLLFTYGMLPAILVSFCRIILSGFMFGNLFSIVYSLSGFLLSFLVMALLKKTGRFNITGISAVGGVSHNIGQLILASFVLNRYVFSYLPVLILAGVISGLVVGVVGGILLKRLHKFFPINSSGR